MPTTPSPVSRVSGPVAWAYLAAALLSVTAAAAGAQVVYPQTGGAGFGQYGGAQSQAGTNATGQQSQSGQYGNTNGLNGGLIDPTGGSTLSAPVQIDGGIRQTDGSDLPANPAATLSPANTQLSTAQQNGPVDMRVKPPAQPGEFEVYVKTATGRTLPRFGASLLIAPARDFALPATATVPAAYVINPGDTISIGLTGSVEGATNLTVDTDGRIFIPRVGAIVVAGTRYGDLQARIASAVGGQFRDFRVSVGVRQLRGIRVYVTGFANNPGAYSANSLSTLVNAVLAAGGPSSGGSFRSVKLYRRGRQVTDFDLYDLLRHGDRSRDVVLQNEDVLFIPPLGEQVAVIGSVNEEAIYELRPGETIERVLGDAGGLTPLADQTRVVLYRPLDANSVGSELVGRPDTNRRTALGGDIVQVLSVGSLQRPTDRQPVLVRIEGEVAHPGNFYVSPGTSLDQVVAQAGGLTSRAYVFGTRFTRLSVLTQQRAGFLEAINQLEIAVNTAPLTASSALGLDERNAQQAAGRAFLDRLRRTEPDGRIVLSLAPDATRLPGSLVLENNDRVVIPPRSSTVSVFGAVFRPASFLLDADNQPRRARDYIEQAGGPIRGADRGRTIVVRANGDVISARRGSLSVRALPGDVIFVPVRTQGNTLLAKIGQLIGIVSGVALTAASVAVIAR